MPKSPKAIEHRALATLVAAHLASATVLADPDHGGWAIFIRYGKTEALLTAKRGTPRLFAHLDSAIAYLRGLGLAHCEVDAQGLDPSRPRTPRRPRPDRAAALRHAHQAARAARRSAIG
jgi:hypothetical protein